MKSKAFLLALPCLVAFANINTPYFKGSDSSYELNSCFDRDGCLDLNQKVIVNVGLDKKVPIGYLLSLLSNKINYPIILRCGDDKNSCYDIKISYYANKKPLLQVLKEIASLSGLYVKLTPKGIVFYKYEQATLQIPLPPFTKDVVLEDKGKNNEDFKAKYKRDYLGKLEEKLKALLHSKNAKVSISEKGFVFVRGTHEEVEAVKKAVTKIAQTLNREIKLRLNVYLVDVTKGFEGGADWSALLKKKDYFKLAFAGLANFGSQSYMTFTASGSTVTSLLWKLSREKGNVKLITSNLFRVLNAQPLYFSPVSKQRIISKYELSYIEVTGTTNGGTQPTLTVETEDIESGEKLLLVPYYIGKDRIAIDFVRKYSQIDRIVEKTVNLQGYENEIGLPQITSTVQTGQSILDKGDTLILISNDLSLEELKKEGIPFLQNIPLIGSLFSHTKTDKRRLKVIITLTYEGD
jgi:hypothetical protein